MLAVVLQARLDSSRLPEKALLPLGGKPLIFRVMEALNRVPAHLRLLACPDDCTAAFAPLAQAAGFELLAGPKDDVLERYCLAIRRFSIRQVIRATGDNPFVFADAAAALNAEALALGADYAGYSGLPYGAGVEAVKAAALLRSASEAAAPFEREHVCPYLYGHPEYFLLHRPLAPPRWREDAPLASGKPIRLTVDTHEDYERARELFAALDCFGEDGERFRGTGILTAYRKVFPQTDEREAQ
jgi:spore coat polysaccharide biosynthesis protein SpsF